MNSLQPPSFIPTTAHHPSLTLSHTSFCPTTSHRPRPLPHSRSRPRLHPRSPTHISPQMKTYDVEIIMDGEHHLIPIDEDQTLLEGIEDHGFEVKYSCRAGVCTTCAAKIVKGDVDLGQAAISDELKEKGYVLTCSGFPKGEGIVLEMNMFDECYELQYGQFEKGKGVSK